MFSLRRAAARSIRASASIAIVPKPQAQSIASIATRSVGALVARSVSTTGLRAFSQTSFSRNDEESTADESKQPAAATEAAPDNNAVFVQNFAFDITGQDLQDAFSKYGEVESVFVPDTKAFALVYYKNADSVQEAISNVDGTFWHGRRLNVKPRIANNKRERSKRVVESLAPTRTLFIGNIPFDATDADLNELFSKLPNVTDVRVAVDRATGWPRGFAHADFGTTEDAATAKETLVSTEVRGRHLRATFAEENNRKRGPPGGQRPNRNRRDSESSGWDA